VFVLSPQVPAFSPVTINSIFKSVEKVDAIICSYFKLIILIKKYQVAP